MVSVPSASVTTVESETSMVQQKTLGCDSLLPAPITTAMMSAAINTSHMFEVQFKWSSTVPKTTVHIPLRNRTKTK